MTRPDWIDTLRADLRPADPDPVLLAQLAQLSASSTVPAARPGRSASARLAIVLGGAIAVGATSWAAGALPGTDSPFRPEEQVTQQPTDPTPGGFRTPLPESPTSPVGEPRSPTGDDQDSSSPPVDAPPDGAPANTEGPRVPEGVPPGPRVSVPGTPELPVLPDLPDVPAVSEPPGLSHVPSLPATSGLPDSSQPQKFPVDRSR